MVDKCRIVRHLRPDDGEYLVDDLVLDVVENEQSRLSFLLFSFVISLDTPVGRGVPRRKVVRGLPKGDPALKINGRRKAGPATVGPVDRTASSKGCSSPVGRSISPHRLRYVKEEKTQ